MAKFVDFSVSPEVTEIMEKILESFPNVFPGFDASKIGCTHAHDKEAKNPIALIAVRYPHSVWNDKVYICSVRDATWKKLNEKQRNLAVFHTMCAIPEGAFDPESNNYGRVKRPDIQMFTEEFAVCGGVPNWMENPEARDPMEVAASETKKSASVKKNPVTVKAVAEV